MQSATQITEEAIRILGKKGVVLESDCAPFLEDINGAGSACLFVAKPSKTSEVSEIVSLCDRHNVAIVSQGGNSNLCRMAIPTERQPTVLLSMSRMDRIEEINADRATVTVEAGCIMQSVQEAVLGHGLLFAPDWGARGTATVGGAVSTNGGGLNVLKYGTTREQVLGLEVVLSDGRVWNGLRSLIKDNSGYDLKQLFIGSEGTLGIITRLTFKLHPAKTNARSMFASIQDFPRLMDFFSKARNIAGERLTAFELLPSLGVEKALKRYPDLVRPIETRADWYVLLRMADNDSLEDLMVALFEEGFETGVLSDAVLASSEAQENNLWELREQMIPHQYFGEYQMLKWDVSVPIDRIAPFLESASVQISSYRKDAFSFAVGHVGDGNIHLSAYLDKTKPNEALEKQIYAEIDALIWKEGGSVVAEHGVGSLFRDRVATQKDQIEYELMQRVKSGFDPRNIFNPGKLLYV